MIATHPGLCPRTQVVATMGTVWETLPSTITLRKSLHTWPRCFFGSFVRLSTEQLKRLLREMLKAT